ncbi:MAG TPA: peptide deformylase [Candidatus Dojkabacteria bacterium]|nr:peptide deformylase [Candidatus Dojkabacteria bacterium]
MQNELKILTVNNKDEEKKLRIPSVTVSSDEIHDPSFVKFTKDLLYTAKKSKIPACGIAAPQVGVHKRLFYMLNYDTDEWELFINPHVEPFGFMKITLEESCLSIPNVEKEVLRYKNVKVKYQDINGNEHVKRYRDYNAVTIQHESDHLDGILFIDKAKE